MQKNLIVGIVVAALLGIAALAYVSQQGKDPMSGKMMESEKAMMDDKPAMEESAMMKKDDGMMEGTAMAQDKMMAGGQYMPYDPAKLAFAKEGKVVLFFNASWCPQCRAIDKDLKESLGDIPKDLLILSVDYDSMKDLKKRYDVTTQHTFVQVDASGTELTKWVGGATLEEIVEKVK